MMNPLKERRSSFIAIDGEGKNTTDGGHIYTYLANSRGGAIRNPSGLSTIACLNFLLDCRSYGTVVGFSINYDVNMMLSDLPKELLEKLWENGWCVWFKQGSKYRIHWRPSKMLQVTRQTGSDKHTVQVWDVFGFFQKSFVKSLREWKTADEATCDRIEAMKEQRGDFANVSDREIEAYCNEECKLLEAMVARLDATFRAVGIKLSRYDGAGAAASALLREHRMKQHLVHFDVKTERLFLRAYFGGRNEVYQLGDCGPGHNYDINSAYPAAMLRLPTLRGAAFTHSYRYNPYIKHAIWRVRWNLADKLEIGPFPLRLLDNSIIYARNGHGWYHAAEVFAAKQVFGDGIRIQEGYYLPNGLETPFSFIESVYKQRAALKANGDLGQLPLKLALNSLYGKMAQGYGWKKDAPPPYQQYFWAGEVTARTRAKLLLALAQSGGSAFAVATDGIFVGEQLNLPVSKALGDWEHDTFTNYFSAQGGVYQLDTENGLVQRNRGFGTKDIDFQLLREEWKRRGVGARVSYSCTRFVGLGRALASNFDDWQHWKTSERKLSITTGNKWMKDGNRLYLTSIPDTIRSTPYQPKQSWLDFQDAQSIAEERDQP